MTSVVEQEVATIPWYQFFDNLRRLAIDNAFLPAIAFAASNTTTGTGVARVYRFTGSTGATLSLEANLLALGSEEAVYAFSIVDEGGSAGTNAITVSGGAATISGENSVLIDTNYGALTLYTNGVAFFIV